MRSTDKKANDQKDQAPLPTDDLPAGSLESVSGGQGVLPPLDPSTGPYNPLPPASLE